MTRTKQETFDYVAAHLLKQGKRCTSGLRIRYRHDGSACAIGCLIPAEEYIPALEPLTLRELRMRVAALVDTDYTLVRDLQRVHDTVDVKQWRASLEAVANTHGLRFRVLKVA